MGIYIINGKFFTQRTAKIPITQELLRGFGVFETLRTYEKVPYQTQEHIHRLFVSAKYIGLKINYNAAKICKTVKLLADRSPHKTQRIKITALKNTLIISSHEQKIDRKIYREGIMLKSIIARREMPEIKSISYILPFLCHERARKHGAFDALLVDVSGLIYEGAYSNIFWFRKGKLYTKSGEVLQGITAKTIIKISPFKVHFANIGLSELKKCDEIFVTTSIYGIVPVKQIDKQKIGKCSPGTMTKQLLCVFDDACDKTLKLQK